MPKPRTAIKLRQEEKSFVVRFRHPVSGKVQRWKLGAFPEGADEAAGKLTLLNRVFMDQTKWITGDGLTEELLTLWNGSKAGVRIKTGGNVTIDGVAMKGHLSAGERAAYEGAIETLNNELIAARAEATKFRRQLEHVMGKKVRSGPCLTLREALDRWTALYVGRDSDHAKIVKNDLERFVTEFKEDTELDALEGEERRIDAWLRGLKILNGERKGTALSAGRRQQMRMHVVKFLIESGVQIDRTKINRPGKDEVRTDRGAIRWLEKKQATDLAEKLPAPWSDYFRVQMIGLRPDELITLHRSNFDSNFTRVTLAELDTGLKDRNGGALKLTLKQGPRTIVVPTAVGAIIKHRVESGDVVFPDPETGKPWADPKKFNRKYLKALRAAAAAAKIETTVDCRTARRTCGSILLRDAKMTVAQVGAILGDNVQTVTEHYAQILSKEVDPSAAAIEAPVLPAKKNTKAKRPNAKKRP